MVLFVVAHKTPAFVPEGRSLIGVGVCKSEIEGLTFRDDSGENIAEKNPNYCELTALYWIWKNSAEEIVGVEHYRRFFCERHRIFRCRQLSFAKISSILEQYDCILPKKKSFLPNNYRYYARKHFASDLDLCRQIISERTPEYTEDFDWVMRQRNAVMCNMCVMRKADFDAYCEWLFGILFRLEESIELEQRDSYQRRVFGFLSERLFNVWLRRRALKVYFAPVYYPNECPILSKPNEIVKSIKRRIEKK